MIDTFLPAADFKRCTVGLEPFHIARIPLLPAFTTTHQKSYQLWAYRTIDTFEASCFHSSLKAGDLICHLCLINGPPMYHICSKVCWFILKLTICYDVLSAFPNGGRGWQPKVTVSQAYTHIWFTIFIHGTRPGEGLALRYQQDEYPVTICQSTIRPEAILQTR